MAGPKKRQQEDHAVASTSAAVATGSGTKAARDINAQTASTQRQQQDKTLAAAEDEMGEFEDAFEDEDGDDEGEVVIAPDSDDEDDEDVDMEAQQELDQEAQEDTEDVQVYLPGQKMEEDEVLVVDHSAYEMLHAMNVEWPCLSFDIIRDQLGSGRTSFPMTSYVVAGSQAATPTQNRIYVMKMSSMHRTKNDGGDNDDDDDDDDDDLDDDAILEHRAVPHMGGVNRVRLMPIQDPHVHIAATLADTGKVHIYDLSLHVASFDQPGTMADPNLPPIHTITAHGSTEGYGIDWSPLQTGHLLTGDGASRIFLTTRSNAAFVTESKPFVGHTSSIEDIQWSPSQQNVFASASADRTIRIWDARDRRKPQLTVHAHDSDVNVISWNRIRGSDHVLASGSDSGAFSIWDLRTWPSSRGSPQPSASFKWHQGPVTSIDWHPTESSVLAVSGADDQVTIWDLALERDPEEEAVMTTGAAAEQVEVPPQLLFIHQGQHNVKEIHWHRQIPGTLISTAFDGFNVFKTINSN
eukprot:jgi/Hompol1/6007/HPOL_004801-RA